MRTLREIHFALEQLLEKEKFLKSIRGHCHVQVWILITSPESTRKTVIGKIMSNRKYYVLLRIRKNAGKMISLNESQFLRLGEWIQIVTKLGKRRNNDSLVPDYNINVWFVEKEWILICFMTHDCFFRKNRVVYYSLLTVCNICLKVYLFVFHSIDIALDMRSALDTGSLVIR